MGKASHKDRGTTVRKVNLTLRGPVLDVLCELVPDVRRLPRDQALELLLDDLDLLTRCFQTFNQSPDRFRHLLIDQHKVPVQDAEALLECGRSLEDVVAMVVRTAAKRYFRHHLDGGLGGLRPKRRRVMARRGLLHKLRALLGAVPAPSHSRPLTRGEKLYREFQDYLRHDWQVPMIPEYSQLPSNTVKKLGARILDYRLPEDIRRLRVDPDNPPAPTPLVRPEQQVDAGYGLPPALRAEEEAKKKARVSDGMALLRPEKEATDSSDQRARLIDILNGDGRRLKPDAFAMVLLDPKVRAVIPETVQSVRITSMIGAVSGVAGRMLVGELALRIDQLAVFLMCAHGTMGEKNFLTAFGVPGRPDFLTKLVEKAKAKNIGQHSSLKDIAGFVTAAFNGSANL